MLYQPIHEMKINSMTPHCYCVIIIFFSLNCEIIVFWSHSFKQTSVYLALIGIFFLLLNLQMVTVVPIGNNGIKAYHVFSLLFLIPVIKRRHILLPPHLISIFFVLTSGISVIAYTIYTFDFLIINYIFSFFTFCIILNCYHHIPVERILQTLRITSLIIISIVSIKDIFYLNELISFIINPNGHPMIYYLYGGGPNLEATWVMLSSAFFLGHRLFYPYIIWALVLATLYASRTATLLGLMFMLYPFIPVNKAGWVRIMAIFSGFILLIATLLILYPELYVFQRFMDVGHDPGSQGRLKMWQYLLETLWQNPFGHGAGNAIWAIEKYSQVAFEENNIHNYFAQILMDFGPLTLLSYLLLTAALFIREIANRFKSPLGAYLILYTIACLVQFRGAEAITWFVVGLYYIEYLQRKTPKFMQPEKLEDSPKL